MEPEQRRAALAPLELLRTMTGETRQRVAALIDAVSEEQTYPAGEALVHEGRLAIDRGFVLLAGRVAIEKEGAPDPIELAAPQLLGEMSQFNPAALRTATVRALEPCEALTFSWSALYEGAREALGPEAQEALLEGVERIVWERFDQDTLMDVALFRDAGDRTRLRALLALLWLTQPLTYEDGETLFARDALCCSMGYLLVAGQVRLAAEGQAVTVTAPNLLGVLPKLDPSRQWSATATAAGPVKVLRFPWPGYVKLLEERLSAEELREITASIQAHAREHFVH